MTEVLESVITATTLRTAIRAKIDAGVSSRAISQLINIYAPAGAGRGREDDSGGQRLPVEVIPHEWRVAFLVALDKLRDDDAAGVAATTDRLAG